MSGNYGVNVRADGLGSLGTLSNGLRGANNAMVAFARVASGDLAGAAVIGVSSVKHLTASLSALPGASAIAVLFISAIGAAKSYEAQAEAALQKTRELVAEWKNAQEEYRSLVGLTDSPVDSARKTARRLQGAGSVDALAVLSSDARDNVRMAQMKERTATAFFGSTSEQGLAAARELKNARDIADVYDEAYQDAARSAKAAADTRRKLDDESDQDLLRSIKLRDDAEKRLYESGLNRAQLIAEKQREIRRLNVAGLNNPGSAESNNAYARAAALKLEVVNLKQQEQLQSESDQASDESSQAAWESGRRQMRRQTFDDIRSRVSPDQQLTMTRGRIADLEKELAQGGDRDAVLAELQQEKLKQFDIEKQITEEKRKELDSQKQRSSVDVLQTLRDAIGAGTLRGGPRLARGRNADSFRKQLTGSATESVADDFRESLKPMSMGSPRWGVRPGAGAAGSGDDLSVTNALLRDQNEILKRRLGVGP